MANVTLRQLRYFEALARLRHFGRAAEACAISQPALSVQMKDLESLLGAPLVERGPREVRLTRLGEALAPRAREVLRAVEEIEDLARASLRPFAGRLGIGVIPTVAPYLLPALMKDLAETWPELDLRPRETVTATLVRDLLDGRLDAAVVALPISEPALVETPLFAEEFVLVRPLADADRPVPSAESLREMRLLLLEEGHCFRDQALDFCGLGAAPPRDLMEGSTLATLVQMVAVGIGVTLIPEMAVPVETASAPVSLARLTPPRPMRTIGMVWRRSSPLADQLAIIAQRVRDVAQAAAPGPG
ncbi:LysR substrate-binding domain-containing protein [Albimonas sp. CAU 1670]|uniref:LysR substrate-binding domain-containing protein n=1 Tax=Albimonas sp. CAU 1670 TaxID=3032599 RepID=UPI0023DA1199|nr:LysR substrate-binding domain-containing protein [Albimonas sp. CAU 1670]MDF2233386.1 LysR substrate-binding domain-containing protein [Albimonas sp. CAU 1670]